MYDLHNIYTLNHKNDSIQKLYSHPYKDNIQSACLNPTGDFWIGSNKGLYLHKTKQQKTILINNHLLKNISSLIRDNHGRLWIGTENHLLAWIPD